MSHDATKQKERLRKYLNPAIQGPNTDAILEALSKSAAHLIHQVEAVYDNLYIVTAEAQYLDQRLADRNITRPEQIGLSDDIFRKIGISVATKKQIRTLILDLLRIIYGEEFTRATLDSTVVEPYALQDGDELIIKYDDNKTVTIKFNSSQFTNIAAATAQEVADAIVKSLRENGINGLAVADNLGFGNFVRLFSTTDGSSSSIQVLGGRAQNELKFPSIISTTADASTQWQLTLEAGGIIKAVWVAGANPKVGLVKKGDYVNVFGSAFNSANRGTFTVVEAQGGTVGNAYVKWYNPLGVSETVIQGTNDAILFFNPKRATLNDKLNYATLYQVNPRTLEIFIPATTKVVRRFRIGSAHLYDTGASVSGSEGPYLFDITKGYVIGSVATTLTADVTPSTERIINVADSSQFPDETGYIVLSYGTEIEEGPIKYLSVPSSTTILVDPSYTFQNTHKSGADVSLVAQTTAIKPRADGTDYQGYLTDIVSGRLYAQQLIKDIAASGINLIITILFPSDNGLGKWGTDNSEKFFVWGEDKI